MQRVRVQLSILLAMLARCGQHGNNTQAKSPEPPKPDNDTSNDASELALWRRDFAEAVQKLEQAEARSTSLAAAAEGHAHLANRPGCPLT